MHRNRVLEKISHLTEQTTAYVHDNENHLEKNNEDVDKRMSSLTDTGIGGSGL